jgi:hypothetical protein
MKSMAFSREELFGLRSKVDSFEFRFEFCAIVDICSLAVQYRLEIPFNLERRQNSSAKTHGKL